MKVLGIVAGRHNGNSEILVKEALLACQMCIRDRPYTVWYARSSMIFPAASKSATCCSVQKTYVCPSVSPERIGRVV